MLPKRTVNVDSAISVENDPKPAYHLIYCQPLLLLGSHCDETLGRDDNSITPLKLTHDHLDLFPHHLTFGVAYLLKKWAHLRKGIPSVLHRCGERREPLGACYDFDGHLTEAGSLECAAKHSGIT